MRYLLKQAGLDGRVEVDSAGTTSYHAGEPPDARAQKAAGARGIQLVGPARRFTRGDWSRFDYVLAMDRDNFDDLAAMAPNGEARTKLRMLRSFDPNSGPHDPVPDPYYGGKRGFDDVLDLCEAACRGLLDHIRKEHGI
jgi:protein-tyrosine phosphatase